MGISTLYVNVFTTLLIFWHGGFGLNNGLYRTPPMGWMSWTKFYCEIDCVRHPNACINEDLYKAQADRMAADGYKDVGYVSVHIDDCWMANERAPNGSLLPNATRFPSGIAALADYMHNKGLKLAIYEDYGTKTCGGYPGSYGYIEQDANTFAAWGVDYLKLDGCNVNTSYYPIGYPQMEAALNATGRPIGYSCSWPAYIQDQEALINYTQIATYCNLWRNYDDIYRAWKSIAGIIAWYVKWQDMLIPVNGPGQWNDPDMIIAGNSELTDDQARAQMTIWSIWSAPLILSNDLRTVTPSQKAIMQNTRVIAVDQDPLGIMGRMMMKIGQVSIFVKRMTPCNNDQSVCSYAIAVLNENTKATTTSFKFSSLGLNYANGYNVQELWNGTNMGVFKPSDTYQATAPATGVHFIKATPTVFFKKFKYGIMPDF